MDLLFKRYASPFSFMDMYIENGRFSEFVSMVKEKSDDDYIYQIWLNRVQDKSFKEFKQEIQEEALKRSPLYYSLQKKRSEATVAKSMNILEKFNPGGEMDGTV